VKSAPTQFCATFDACEPSTLPTVLTTIAAPPRRKWPTMLSMGVFGTVVLSRGEAPGVRRIITGEHVVRRALSYHTCLLEFAAISRK